MTSHLGIYALLALLLAAAGEADQKSTRHCSRNKAALTNSEDSSVTWRCSCNKPQLVTVKAANVMKFDFGDDRKLENELMDSGRYDPKALMIYDFAGDWQSRNRIFGSIPLARRGIPATLISAKYDGPTYPLPTPYPSWDIHRTTEDTITDCSSQLVSVTKITKTWTDDDTLYVIDSGVLDITTSPKRVCQPKIVMFDLRTDEVIKSIIIKNAACCSLYLSLWVDDCSSGSLTAYSADVVGNRLTVTDLNTGVSKHLQSQYFYPDPDFFFTKAGGPSVYMPYGLWGVTADANCDGKLYFQAFASNVQGVLDKHVIYHAKDGDVLDTTTKLVLPGKLSGPSGPMAVDHDGQRLFFPVQDELAIYCWNTSKPHDPKNFRKIIKDDARFKFISNIEIQTKTQELCIQNNPFTLYVSNTTNYSEDNYHVLCISIKGLEC